MGLEACVSYYYAPEHPFQSARGILEKSSLRCCRVSSTAAVQTAVTWYIHMIVSPATTWACTCELSLLVKSPLSLSGEKKRSDHTCQ